MPLPLSNALHYLTRNIPSCVVIVNQFCTYINIKKKLVQVKRGQTSPRQQKAIHSIPGTILIYNAQQANYRAFRA